MTISHGALKNGDARFARRLKKPGKFSSSKGGTCMEYPNIRFCKASISEAIVAEKGEFGQQSLSKGKMWMSISNADLDVGKDLIMQ